MNPEFYKMLYDLFSQDRSDDFSVIAASREHGFDPEEAWESVGRILAMVAEDDALAFAADELRMARALRKRKGRRK